MTTVPTEMTVEEWNDKYFEDFLLTDWFKKFSDDDSNAMIHVVEDLVEKPGTKIHLNLVNELTGRALGENDTYSGNEASITLRDFEIEVHEYGNAVKAKAFEQKKTAIGIRQVNKSALMNWNKQLHRSKIVKAMTDFYGTDGITKPLNDDLTLGVSAATEAIKDEWLVLNADRVLFGANLSNNSSNDHSASLANIDSTNDKLTTDAIDIMKYMAKNPASGKTKVRPTTPRKAIDETDAYVLFTPTLSLRDLKKDTAFLNANREARMRGIENPLFKGANWIWDNVAIYEIEDMPILTGVGASGINVGVSKLMGAQAIGVAWGKRPWTVENEFTAEYKRFHGLGIMQYYEVEKLRWGTGVSNRTSPVDHGMVTGYFSATAYA